ncbi:Trehalose-6-phosphate phosphatase [Moorella humiferrea]|uniref:trehalose-phosphatase n=1 Tax=Neomoorella humiferrea TaxID=676965 RepID=UPI0030D3DD9A
MSPNQLAAKIRAGGEVLLMCDYDGTLVPLAPHPSLARPGPHLLDLLRRLVMRPHLHMAVISGRSLDELRELLPVAGLYLVGLHGAYVLTPDKRVVSLIPSGKEKIPWAEIFKLAQKLTAGLPGFYLENKGEAVAIHYRLAPPKTAASVLHEFRRSMEPYHIFGIEFLEGNKVLEVRRRGINKGLAATYFIKKWPGALPVYLGDDKTDADAFSALPPNGLAVRVGNVLTIETPYFLPSAKEVVELLAHLV